MAASPELAYFPRVSFPQHGGAVRIVTQHSEWICAIPVLYYIANVNPKDPYPNGNSAGTRSAVKVPWPAHQNRATPQSRLLFSVTQGFCLRIYSLVDKLHLGLCAFTLVYILT